MYLPQWKRNLMTKASVALNRDSQPGRTTPSQAGTYTGSSGLNAGASGLVGAGKGGLNSAAAGIARKKKMQNRLRNRVAGPKQIGTGNASAIGNGMARGLGL